MQPDPPPLVIDPILIKKAKMAELMGSTPIVIPVQPDFTPIISTFKVLSYHQFMGSAFLEDYNINTKNTKFNVNERKFDKNKSVFKDWRLDIPGRI